VLDAVGISDDLLPMRPKSRNHSASSIGSAIRKPEYIHKISKANCESILAKSFEKAINRSLSKS